MISDLISYQYFKGKPGIAHTFDIEEGYVRIGLRFVQKPAITSIRSFHCNVPDDGHPHIGMGLQAERQDRNADEEHRNHANSLEVRRELVKIL